MQSSNADPTGDSEKDVVRVEAFSVGVFAFAVTLLVLGIRIPRLDDPDARAGLQQLIVQQWPSYVAFALTFVVVGTVWANHRLAFSHFARTDHVLVSLNLLELMSVAFLPVPTGILGNWVESDKNRFAAVLLYGGTLAVVGLFHNLLWLYSAYGARLTSPSITSQQRRALTLTWMAGPILYVLCIALAFIDPRLSLVGFAALGIAYLLPTPGFLMLAQRARGARGGRRRST